LYSFDKIFFLSVVGIFRSILLAAMLHPFNYKPEAHRQTKGFEKVIADAL